MVVDGTILLQMVKDNKFEDGDEIRPQITTNDVYVYSAYYRNFTNKKTGNQLTVQEYVFWTFDVEEKRIIEINIPEVEPLIVGDLLDAEQNIDIESIVAEFNDIIIMLKQLDKKIK